jgi:pimeloyl-ACP methyl ester carboxylesterase
MPRVTTADGVSLHYADDDFTDPWLESKPAVLLHHGFGRSSVFWYAWVPALGRLARVIRLDARGFGQSSVPPPENKLKFEHFVEDVLRVLDHLKITKVHYGGESFGGIVGGALAALHPDRVETLTIVASPTRVNEHGQRLSSLGYPSYSEALSTLGSAEWARATNPTRFPADADPRMTNWFADELGKTSVDWLLRIVELYPHANLQPFLPRIIAPTLLIYPRIGKYANELPYFQKGIRNLKVDIIDAEHHAIATTHADLCAAHMARFIRGHMQHAG